MCLTALDKHPENHLFGFSLPRKLNHPMYVQQEDQPQKAPKASWP